jgi:hypothetical protein
MHLNVGYLTEGPVAAHTGVGDEDVHRTEVLLRPDERLLHLGGAPGVSYQAQAVASRLLDELDCLLEVVGSRQGIRDSVDLIGDIPDGHIYPCVRQGQGMGASLPTGPSGDDGNLSLQRAHLRTSC